jgi:hypothetical protein
MERYVLRLIRDGYRNKQIAAELAQGLFRVCVAGCRRLPVFEMLRFSPARAAVPGVGGSSSKATPSKYSLQRMRQGATFKP